MTLLSICQDAADEIGIPQPSTVAGNPAPEAQKLFRYANKVGKRLVSMVEWQDLRIERTFSAIAGETQTGIIPADFDRFVPETFWDRSGSALLSGPITSAEWGGLKAQNYSGVVRKFIYRGGSVLVLPAFAGGESLAFEYISTKWVLATDGTTYKTAFSADTDTPSLDEELITHGVAYEFLNGEGLPSAVAKAAYEERFELMVGNDQPVAGIMMAGDVFGRGSRYYNGSPAGTGGFLEG